MVVENAYLEDIQRIWKENNSGYITYESNQMAIKDKKMKQLVWRENNITMAYAIVYLGKDFCEKDEYPNRIANMPEKVVYIWEIVTDKKYTGKGIANKLMEYIIDQYNDFSIYSCVDLSNIPSFKLHKKNGFKVLYEFEKNENSKSSLHAMMVKNGKEI